MKRKFDPTAQPSNSKSESDDAREPNNSRRNFLKTGGLVAAGVALGGHISCDSAGAERTSFVVRKNVKNLSALEKSEFVDAIHALKRTRSPIDPSLSYYDQFVRFHQLSVLRARLELGHGIAHENPAFPPWHRKLLLMFENAVQDVTRNSHFALPYWDWADPSSIPFVFNDDLMGPEIGDPSDNYAVDSGPFRKGKYELNLTASALFNTPVPPSTAPLDPLSMCPFPFLTRGEKFDQSDPQEPVLLPTQGQVDALLEVDVYDTFPYDVTADIDWSFRNYLNGAADSAALNPIQQKARLHNLIHVWVGGTWTNTTYPGTFLDTATTTFVGSMTALDCSPNDPCFWLHHCNVDRLWAIWEDIHGISFEPTSGENQGWNLNDELYPYVLYKQFPVVRRQGITNASMLDFRKLGYTYEEL